MYSEFEVRRQIDTIENGDDSPIRKARRLLTLSRKIRHFTRRIDHGTRILRHDDDEAAQRMQQTLNCLKRLQEEARLAAFKALKSGPESMGFEVKPEREATPHAWAESKRGLEAVL